MQDPGELHICTSDFIQVDDMKTSKGVDINFPATIHEAFAGDDVTQQFEEEKCLMTDVKKASEEVLPGKYEFELGGNYNRIM